MTPLKEWGDGGHVYSGSGCWAMYRPNQNWRPMPL